MERFSSAPHSHPVRLLTLVRRAACSEQHYVCLAVVLAARDRSLTVSTKEELLQSYCEDAALAHTLIHASMLTYTRKQVLAHTLAHVLAHMLAHVSMLTCTGKQVLAHTLAYTLVHISTLVLASRTVGVAGVSVSS